jgi:hypothetical protein
MLQYQTRRTTPPQVTLSGVKAVPCRLRLSNRAQHIFEFIRFHRTNERASALQYGGWEWGNLTRTAQCLTRQEYSTDSTVGLRTGPGN